MTRRRKALLALLVAALAGSTALLSYRTPPAPDQDFHLQLMRHAEVYPTERLAGYPMFDPATDRWLLAGRPVSRVAALLTDTDPEGVGPDSIGKYLMFRLPDDAGSDAFRKAIASLAADGICQVAVADDATPTHSDLRESLVYRVMQVRDASGRMRTCVDRFNPRIA
jgi:hypothetical protein